MLPGKIVGFHWNHVPRAIWQDDIKDIYKALYCKSKGLKAHGSIEELILNVILPYVETNQVINEERSKRIPEL
jgi:hypothetical protein